ncbi:hypothetical protein DCAR_0207944 [Daucus carota subsp. sativus]|uniref:RRM domain-containing protein n=1 Tax=Daucus carota subsp. sativus TaxID=79200 RepID=A0AAF1AMJ6_DAUCS|nr:hypothetical protein DCAR_0207944 [Daucus carota subsp. sativus]
MDPMAGEKLNYDQEEESQYKQQGGGAISAPAEDEFTGDDVDEYDELYGDLNINEGFLQPQPSEVPGPNGAVNVAQNGESRLFVGELHWWTTDAEIESVLSQYGRVKELKFYDEKHSGKSRGYCLVEFYDSASAAVCKEGMDGYHFNGRACTVVFASPQNERQMAQSHSHSQSQSQPQGRRSLNDNAVIITCGTPDPTGDFGRGFGRGGLPRGRQGGGHRRFGPNWGIGASMRPNMPSARGFGADANSGGFMNPHCMMGAGFDPTLGRGLPRPTFPGMIPPFRNVTALEMSGAFRPVNPAFFGGGMAAYGMGMMGFRNVGMAGPSSGMWNYANMGGGRVLQQLSESTSESSSGSEANTGGGSPEQRSQRTSESNVDNEANMGGGRPEEQAQRTRDSSLVSEANTGGGRLERRGPRTRDSSLEYREHRYRDRGQYSEDRYRERRQYREERDDYDHHRAYRDDHYDRGQTSARSKGKAPVVEEDHGSSRWRDAYHGKRRRWD